MKILIVEDNAGVRRLLRRVVAETASCILECADGADALAAYSEHLPDIVLMDIRMPRVDGLVATRQIIKAYPSARIVIVTDYDDDTLRRTAEKAGACAFALKQNLTGIAELVASVAHSGLS